MKKILAVSFVATLAVIACTAEGPTTPPQTETIQRAPETPAVAATPAPTPVATPAPGTSSFELTGAKPSTIYVKYTGEASFVTIVTFYTSFDDQNTQFGKQSHTVKSGDTVTRAFDGICIQGDADQEGVKEIGGVFFDINGAPFNPTRNPEKVTECRGRCVPEFRDSTTYEYGEYDECKRGESQEGCYQSRKVTTIITTVNTCTKESKEKSRTVSYETRSCECPCVERLEALEIPGQANWNQQILEGRCEVETFPVGIDTVTPQLNCRQTGTQTITLDWLCKADETRTRNLCRNVACPTPACTYPQPSFSNTVFREEDRQPGYGTDWWVEAEARVQGAATWKLEIYSASSLAEYVGDDPDFTKASSARTLTCDQFHNFNLEYHSDNHGSDVWWAALYRNNVRVWKSQAEFN